jgi:hypothetical protein
MTSGSANEPPEKVDKRLNRKGPQDVEFWATYTTVTNELLDAVRQKNEPAHG